MTFVVYPIAFLAVIGAIVLVHEFGHLVVAKAFGIGVQTFSLGFGKRLTGFHVSGTDYRISTIPFGGYVKMLGDELGSPLQDCPQAFNSHPRWQRALVAAAGPFANLIFTILVMTGVYFTRPVHTQHLDQRPLISSVVDGSIAASAGFRPGDLIKKIDNDEVSTWRDVFETIPSASNQPFSVEVLRQERRLVKQLLLVAAEGRKRPSVGWVPEEPNTVSEVEPGSPAERAGIEMGDQIISINGVKVRKSPDLLNAVKEARPSYTIVALRGTKRVKLMLERKSGTPLEQRDSDSVLGLHLHFKAVPEISLGAAFMRALEFSKSNLDLIYRLFVKMLQGKISARQIEGPIGIMRASGEAAQERGWHPLFTLMAFISLNIAVFNLFPLPVLDGGMLLLLGIESLMRRDLQPRVRLRIYTVAFLFLLLIFAVVLYNDISKLLATS